MSNVLVNKNTLLEIAEAIREKNGKEELYKPAEMPDAILEIESGIDHRKPIKFYGYEGELVYNFSLDEIEEMTELPPFPEAEGMICQEWNWTLEELKNHKREANVGAIFTTDDGSTRIYISLVESALSPILGFAQSKSNCVKVDWGDGSPLETSEVSGPYSSVDMQHQYKQAGDYVIRLIPEEGSTFFLTGTSKGTGLLRKVTSTSSNENYVYSSAIKKVELGTGISSINSYAFASYTITHVSIPNDVLEIKSLFRDASALEYVAIPRKFNAFPTYMFGVCNCLRLVCVPGSLTELGAHCFANCNSLDDLTLPDGVQTSWNYTWYYCKNLKKIVIPKSLKRIRSSDFSGCDVLKEVVIHDEVEAMESSAFYYCEFLKEIEIPEGVTEIGNQAFMYCNALQKVKLPESLTSIGSSAFSYCYGLSKMVIPKNVTDIGYSAFNNTAGIDHYYMYPETPPTLTNKNTFNYISSTCKIHVPKGCLEVYQAAEYWSEYADYMVEMED